MGGWVSGWVGGGTAFYRSCIKGTVSLYAKYVIFCLCLYLCLSRECALDKPFGF